MARKTTIRTRTALEIAARGKQLGRAGYWAAVCMVLRALRALAHPLALQVIDILT